MLLNRSTTLPSGLRATVRLPHSSDRPALRALHGRLGLPVDDLEVTRLMRHDPRLRGAVVALAWTSEGHSLLGLAAGDVGADAPDVLLVDPAAGLGLAELLTAALAERTGPARRPRVA
jgi:hypothetical protein